MESLQQPSHRGAWWHPLIRPYDQVHVFAFPRSFRIDELKAQLHHLAESPSCPASEASRNSIISNGYSPPATDVRWESISPRQEVLLPSNPAAPWFAIIRPLDTQIEGKVVAGFHNCGFTPPCSCSLSDLTSHASTRLTANFLDFQINVQLGDEAGNRELVLAAWNASLLHLSADAPQNSTPGAGGNFFDDCCKKQQVSLHAENSIAAREAAVVVTNTSLSNTKSLSKLRLLQRQGYYPSQMALQCSATEDGAAFQCSWDPVSLNAVQVRACVADFQQRLSALLPPPRADIAKARSINGRSFNTDARSAAANAGDDIHDTGPSKGEDAVRNMTRDDIEAILAYNQRDIPSADLSIATIIHRNATRFPDSTAVDAWDCSVTYKELDEKAAALARRLYQQFGGPNLPVLTSFDKSAVGVIVKLAILRSGNHYVPVDPSHPLERKKMIAEKAGCRVVFCSPAFASIVRELGLQHSLVADMTLIDQCCESTVNSPIDLSNLDRTCSLLATSGSTGTPKLVKLGHKAMSTSLQDQARMLGVQPGSRVLSFASFAFDAHMWDTWVPLLSGATSCIPHSDERMDNIQGFMLSARISIGLLFPAALNLLDPSTLPDLERFYVGGERVSTGQVGPWTRSGKVLGNLYGPTECSVICTANLSLQEHDPSDIGKPIGGKCWITDPNDVNRLLPPGSAGELVVSGDALAELYVGDPSKTDEAFVTPEWPSWAPDVRRAYKTGDLAVLGEDGNMRIRGRKDDQIKLYGHRIERKELEFCIAKCNLHEAVPVIEKIQDGQSGRQQILCFFVPKGIHAPGLCMVLGRSQQLEDLEAALRKRLIDLVPQAWIPHKFVFVTSLPLNTSDKIDRRLLLETYKSIQIQPWEPSKAAEPAATESQNELVLRDVWSKVLGLIRSRIDRTSDFLGLGGSSIDAIKVVAECRLRKLTLSTSDIFAHPILADLATVCISHEAKDDSKDQVERVRTPEPFELL